MYSTRCFVYFREGPVPQCQGRKYPAFNDLYAYLHLGLVPGHLYTSRDDGGPVMGREIMVRGLRAGHNGRHG